MDQDQDNLANVSGSAITLCSKSWTAYLGVAIRLLILIALAITAVYWQPTYWRVTALILLVALLFVGYQIALLRSYRLYYDDMGVWIYSGVLPWKRGVAGVKWRDLDEATFHNSFWSWISRSYTIQLKHRFTKASEIVEANMANGKQVVITINQQQQQRIRQGGAI
jgi:hypothetical protein